MTTPQFTHTAPLSGRRVPVRIVDRYEYASRPWVRVEAAACIFPHRGTEGGWHSNRATYPAGAVREIPAPEAEADVELAFGLVLLREDAPAEEVNAAMSAWRLEKGYAEVGS